MKEKNKQRDFFWVYLVAGVIAVSALAWFLGKWGGTMLVNRQSGRAQQGEIGPGGTPGAGLSEEERAERIGQVEGMRNPDVPGFGDESQMRGKSDEPEEDAPDTAAIEGAADIKSGDENTEDTLLVDDAETGEPRAPDTAMTGSETAAPAPPPAGETAGPLYRLQVGIFTRKENALLVKNDLEQNYQMPVIIAEVNLDGEVKFRVQAGAFRNRENAEKMARELRIKGHHAYIWKDEQQ